MPGKNESIFFIMTLPQETECQGNPDMGALDLFRSGFHTRHAGDKIKKMKLFRWGI